MSVHKKLKTGSAAAWAVAIGTAAFGFGCGDDGFGKRYPVTGTVTYKGEPVERGSITFAPVDVNTGRPASGTIQDGEYTLSTAGENDGALPGDYKVTIMAKDVDYESLLAKAKGQAIRQPDIIKAGKTAKLLVPQKYQIPETSGLTAKVEEKAMRFDFPLTD